jgi:predicted lipoprotein
VLRAERRPHRGRTSLALLGAIALAACDVATVRKLDPVTGKAIIEEERRAFDARTWVAANWSARVVPTAEKDAIPLGVLRKALSEDHAAATQRYRSGAGAGRPSFLVTGSARVLAVDTTSRSGVARLDLQPFDGSPDAELQIGPVFRGTALRDALPFIRFDDFTNQLEYASVSRVLHQRVADSVLARIDRARLAGRVIRFHGAYTEGSGVPLLTPMFVRVEE